MGGVRKNEGVPGRVAIRGDIHVLLVGDPGLGKSQLLQVGCAVCLGKSQLLQVGCTVCLGKSQLLQVGCAVCARVCLAWYLALPAKQGACAALLLSCN